MKHIILFFSSLLFLLFIHAQDTLYNPRVYNSKIIQYGIKPVKGYLATIGDSALYLTQNETYLNFDTENISNFQKFDYKTLVSVKLYNRKKKVATFLLGMLTGAVVGALIGHSLGSDQGWFALSADGKALIGGIFGIGVGAIVGGVVVKASARNFFLNGEWKSLHEMKESLLKKR